MFLMVLMEKVFDSEYKGAFLPAEFWEGTVQSVYSKAVNLLHPSGILISLVDGSHNMTDYGLTVKDFNSFAHSVSEGSSFLWKNGTVVFHDLVIGMKSASLWSGAVTRFSDYSLEFMEACRTVFNGSAKADGLSPVVTGRAGNLYTTAARRILPAAGKITSLEDDVSLDVSPLVGLGVGFTPSGDDFISGALLFEVISGKRVIDKGKIGKNLHKTTAGGRTLLTLALRNSFPSYLLEFAEALKAGSGNPVEIVKKALRHGSTSGSDALSGFFWIAELF